MRCRPHRLRRAISHSPAAPSNIAGVIVYETAWPKHGGPAQRTQLVWHARDGQRLGVVGETRAHRGIALSPDGRHIAVHVHEEPAGGSLWLSDQATNTIGVNSQVAARQRSLVDDT